MPQRGAITYEGRPLSRGGVHKLRTRGFVAGYRALQYFAEAVSLDVRPTSLRIEMLEGEGVPKEISLSLRAELDNRYITTRVRTIGAYRGHQWDTDPGLLAQIVKRLAAVGPIPEVDDVGSAVVIHAAWNLRLFDDRTQQVLPHQSADDYLGWAIGPRCYLGCSSLYGRIAEQTSAHVFLSLPFESATEDARHIAAELRARFPARISPNHWKIWKLTKAQDRYVGRKIGGISLARQAGDTALLVGFITRRKRKALFQEHRDDRSAR